MHTFDYFLFAYLKNLRTFATAIAINSYDKISKMIANKSITLNIGGSRNLFSSEKMLGSIVGITASGMFGGFLNEHRK